MSLSSWMEKLAEAEEIGNNSLLHDASLWIEGYESGFEDGRNQAVNSDIVKEICSILNVDPKTGSAKAFARIVAANRDLELISLSEDMVEWAKANDKKISRPVTSLKNWIKRHRQYEGERKTTQQPAPVELDLWNLNEVN